MYSKITLIMVLFFLLGFSGATAQDKSQFDLAIENVHVITMESEEVLENRTVLIDEGKIWKIIPTTMEYGSAEETVDGQGKFLLPGISEMHAHVPVPRDGDDSYVQEVLLLYLSNGITTIRGMLGQPYHLELKGLIETGEILGPRLYTSSPSMNGNSVQSPEEADQKVRQYKNEGYDFLKLHPGLSLENFNALVRTANEVGMKYAGHVSVDVGVKRAIEGGYASIDHLDGYVEGLVPESANVNPNENGFFGYNFTDLADEDRIPVLSQLTKKHDVWIVPTHSLMINVASDRTSVEMSNDPEMKYVSSSTLVGWRNGKQRMLSDESYDKVSAKKFLQLRDKILLSLHNTGVKILLGSDAPQVFNVPGFSIQKEMQAMVTAGMSPYEVLQSGTVNPAEFFNALDQYGTIHEGLSADLILLGENPLVNIENMQQIEGVIVRGKWLSKDWIKQKLSEIETNYQQN